MNLKANKKLNLESIAKKHSVFLKSNLALIQFSLLIVFFVVISLSAGIWYVLATRTTPPSFVFNSVDIEQTVVLNKPDIGNEALMRWSSQVISEIFTFNFLNLNQHFLDVKKYFTEDGYNNFTNIIADKGFARDALDKRLVYAANSCDVVSIKSTADSQSGSYVKTYWLLDIPLLIRVTSASKSELRRYVVSVVIQGGADVSPDKSIGITAINMNLGSGNFCRLNI